jgi:glycosyltransferase involved in cell wall biosynthesis
MAGSLRRCRVQTMRVIVTCEHRFSLAPDGSVWTKVAFDYEFWERYLTAFDTVRIVARAALDANISDRYKRVTGNRIEFWPVPFYLGPEQFLMKRHKVRASLQAAVEENDALVCRVGSPLADELLPVFWRTGRPYGLEVVGDPQEALGPGTVRHPLRRFFQMRASRLLRRECSLAVAVAYVTRETLQKRYPCPAHSVGISDVVRLDFSSAAKVFTTNYSSISWEEDDFAREYRHFRDQGRTKIVFVGSLAQMYKGPDVLLKAVKLLVPDLNPHAVIIGDGKHRSELEQMAAELGISEHVKFLGELPSGRAIRHQLDEATIFVMPSRAEGLPRAMIEAMARALPCIATRVGGIPELLAAEDLVASEDHVGLANKIREVISDPQRLSEMSRRNLERAQEYRPDILDRRRSDFYRFLQDATKLWLDGSRPRAFRTARA